MPTENVTSAAGESLSDDGGKTIPGELPSPEDKGAPEETGLLPEELSTKKEAAGGGDSLIMDETPVNEEETPEEPLTGGPAIEEPALFKQVYNFNDAEMVISAEAGVFPADAALYAESTENEEIARASEEALGVSPGN
ncbi:MAG: hypothetical protein IKN57_10860, partial [Parasporobacterium sp.]|nr:hypothetical protein [Parasporobacterium sp.]